MKRTIKGLVLAVAFAAAGAASAQVTSDQCRRLIGFQGAKLGDPTGAWLAVNTVADADGFRGKKEIPGNCEIKDPILQPKGKPLPGTAFIVQGPMPQDQCSMYKYLGSIDLAVRAIDRRDATPAAPTGPSPLPELSLSSPVGRSRSAPPVWPRMGGTSGVSGADGAGVPGEICALPGLGRPVG